MRSWIESRENTAFLFRKSERRVFSRKLLMKNSVVSNTDVRSVGFKLCLFWRSNDFALFLWSWKIRLNDLKGNLSEHNACSLCYFDWSVCDRFRALVDIFTQGIILKSNWIQYIIHTPSPFQHLRKRRREDFIERILRAPDLQAVYNMTHPNAESHQQETQNPTAPYAGDRDDCQLLVPPAPSENTTFIDLPPAYHDIDYTSSSYECAPPSYDCLHD